MGSISLILQSLAPFSIFFWLKKKRVVSPLDAVLDLEVGLAHDANLPRYEFIVPEA